MKTVLILIDNFYPAYKGGGPIQSITNLVISLQHEYNIYVVTSAYDLQSKVILNDITPDTWNNMILPGSNMPVKVWYADKMQPGYKTFKKLVQYVDPAFIYLNGIFSYNLFMIPLVVLKTTGAATKIIICPRGMLQKGALADKTLKKKIYLKVLKYTGLVNKVVWHATSQEEEEDILKHFGGENVVITAMNIPKPPVKNIVCVQKVPGTLRLVYLSLITEKKNLLFLLKLIKETENISLDIYGPVKDKMYWDECKKIIKEIPEKVKYSGTILPVHVQQKFSEYNASILLTKGENFGHALYESLSVGTPVITSNFTPWNNLESLFAGWNFDISDFDKSVKQLNNIKHLDQAAFSKFCIGSYNLASEYFSRSNDISNYKKLFSTQGEV